MSENCQSPSVPKKPKIHPDWEARFAEIEKAVEEDSMCLLEMYQKLSNDLWDHIKELEK